MKKILLTLCAAAALLITGCNPTPTTDEPVADNGKNVTEFSATIDNTLSRATINGSSSEWNTGDRLTVVRFDVNNTRPKLVISNINNSTISGNIAKFTTEGYVNETGEQYAICSSLKALGHNALGALEGKGKALGVALLRDKECKGCAVLVNLSAIAGKGQTLYSAL